MAHNQTTRISALAAAELLGVSVQTLYRHAEAGAIPAKKLGRRWVFVREQLVAWLADTGGEP